MNESKSELKHKCIGYALKIIESRKSAFEESLTEMTGKVIKASEKLEKYLSDK